ncbi:MAG: sigma-70 family RNA polymerase sigma factor [Acidobacteriota bacterium]
MDQSLDDARIVRRCLDGDGAAFADLVDRYQGVLYNVAHRMLGNEEDARDAAQNAFIKAYEKLATYDADRRFFSWIYRILTNECLNFRRRPAMLALGADTETAEDRHGAPDGVEAAERRRDVKRAILSLPPAYREVIVLRHFGSLSYDEMSDAIGVPVKTVKSRLYSARQQLAGALAAWMER